MQTLDIECPSCGEMLELDAGFAGGVCRCSSCGTLMTVPSDAGKAESLTRPTSSAQVGAGGMSSMGVPDPGPRRSQRAGKSKGKKGKGRRMSSAVEAGEYRTASGKVIRVDETTRVPMAESKKKQIRMATTVVFFSIVAVVVAIAVVGIVMTTGAPGGNDVTTTYNASANPYKLEYANVMGLPVTGRTAIVVEASEYSEGWATTAGDIIAAGLSQPSKQGEIVIVEAAAKGPVVLTGGSPSQLPMDPGQVSGWFGKLSSEGTADIGAAISAALRSEPSTLIIVHGYAELSDVEQWDKLLDGSEGLKLHVVHVGNSSPALESWAAERGGEAVVLSVQDIETLKEMAAEK